MRRVAMRRLLSCDSRAQHVSLFAIFQFNVRVCVCRMEIIRNRLRLTLVVALYLRHRRRRARQRSIWVRPILRRRRQQGEFHNLLQEMLVSDRESHFRYMRMTKQRFDSLLSKVSDKSVLEICLRNQGFLGRATPND